jgi:hypothetical protein
MMADRAKPGILSKAKPWYLDLLLAGLHDSHAKLGHAKLGQIPAGHGLVSSQLGLSEEVQPLAFCMLARQREARHLTRSARGLVTRDSHYFLERAYEILWS